MGNRRARAQGWTARRISAVVITAALILSFTACTDEESGTDREQEETIPAGTADDLLGPANPATGEPVKVGFLTEGAAPTVDTTDETRAALATVDYLNEHRGGIGGHPVELVNCDMMTDSARATDCANQMIEEGVVAVTLTQTTLTEALWQPLHDAGIPLIVLSGFGDALLEDDQSTFVMVNPAAAIFGLPVALAEDTGADKVAFVVIDIPQAVDLLESQGPPVMGKAGLDYEIVRIPLGTPDMTPQMQEVADSGAGVVHVLGNDAFCIAAFDGLRAVGYDGAISAVAQCLTDNTREAVGADLEGIGVLSTLADGATDDPSYQLYQAVMGKYGDEVKDVSGYYALGGYAAVATLAAALETLQGEVTPASVIETIKNMPETELPATGGVKFRCDGSSAPEQPAICTNQWLRSVLDANGLPTSYTVEDSTDLLAD